MTTSIAPTGEKELGARIVALESAAQDQAREHARDMSAARNENRRIRIIADDQTARAQFWCAVACLMGLAMVVAARR